LAKLILSVWWAGALAYNYPQSLILNKRKNNEEKGKNIENKWNGKT
jgi:hypothetical protein